jgi:multicomponent Na+:H+ antiporter subunit C
MTIDHVVGLYNYWIVIFLMMTGFYIVIASKNLIKSIIGLNVFQTSVFLLYITMGKVRGGTTPIIPPELTHPHAGDHAEVGHAVQGQAVQGQAVQGHEIGQAVQGHAEHAAEHVESHLIDLVSQIDHLNPDAVVYSHPLPSVLMLTAIVVGIATTALALALIVRVREEYGTIEEDEILALDRKA